MKIEHREIVREIKANCDSNKSLIIRSCSKVGRSGLYILVIITMIASCDNNDKLIAIGEKINSIESAISRLEGIASDR